MPRAWVELLNRHREALPDLEAAMSATEELGNGGVAKVPALCIGRIWKEGGRQRVLLKEIPLCIHATVLDTDMLALDMVHYPRPRVGGCTIQLPLCLGSVLQQQASPVCWGSAEAAADQICLHSRGAAPYRAPK